MIYSDIMQTIHWLIDLLFMHDNNEWNVLEELKSDVTPFFYWDILLVCVTCKYICVTGWSRDRSFHIGPQPGFGRSLAPLIYLCKERYFRDLLALLDSRLIGLLCLESALWSLSRRSILWLTLAGEAFGRPKDGTQALATTKWVTLTLIGSRLLAT